MVDLSQQARSKKSTKNFPRGQANHQEQSSTNSTLIKHSLFKTLSPNKITSNIIKDSILSAVNSHRLRESLKKKIKKKSINRKHLSPLKQFKNYRFLEEISQPSVSQDLSSNLNYQ